MTWGAGQRKWFATAMTDIGKILFAGFVVAPVVQPVRPSFWLIGLGLGVAGACFVIAFRNQEG